MSIENVYVLELQGVLRVFRRAVDAVEFVAVRSGLGDDVASRVKRVEENGWAMVNDATIYKRPIL